MANKTARGTNFAPETVKEVFSKVKGHSSLVKLSKSIPVAFSGNDIFTFSLDGECAIVGEGEQKPAGAATIEPVKVVPIKVVYQHRVSDEFMAKLSNASVKVLTAAGVDISAIITGAAEAMVGNIKTRQKK